MRTKFFSSIILSLFTFVSFVLPERVSAIDKIKKQDAMPSRLIKLAHDPAVYYQAQNGFRYVFPNQKVYFSWFSDFSNVVVLNETEFSNILIGGTVKYKPNTNLVKITSDPKVYWVDKLGILRHIVSEDIARELFGNDWAKNVNDLDDSFFAGYKIGNAIISTNLPIIENSWDIDDNEDIYLAEANDKSNSQNNTSTIPVIVDEIDQPSDINLTVWIESGRVEFKWIVTGGNTKYGIALIRSITNEVPVYNIDETIKVLDITTDRYTLDNLSNGAYYFSACRINSDGSCGKTSNTHSVAIGTSEKIPSIELSGIVENGIAKFNWKTNWISPNSGFYLVRSDFENPRYGHELGTWISKTSKSYDWSGLSFGTKHFRLCKYTDSVSDLCEYYSNDLELEIK